MPEFSEILDAIYPEIIRLRRSIHAEPEVAWEELKTTTKIADFLKSHGISQISRPLKTGLVADILSENHLPWIAIRADIDALPVQDEKKELFHSQHSDRCHCCGHDMHTAIVSGIGAVLSRGQKKLPVNVRLLFQPAEEPIPSGAPKFIAKGVLEKVSAVWGLHLEPSLPLGTVSLTEGWVNAQSIKLQWCLEGIAAHSARPDLGVDPILAGIELILKLREIVSQKWNTADKPAVLSFTRFCSEGKSYNTIPAEANLVGTLRITDPAQKDLIFSQIHEIHQLQQNQSGIKIHFEAIAGAPPVTNHPAIIQKFTRNLSQSRGLNLTVDKNFRSMGGDDFGWYVQKVPGAFIRFGTSAGDKTAGLHTGMFNPSEDVIRLAILFFLNQIFRSSH